MRQNRQNILEALFDGFWATRKIDDQSATTGAYHTARKHAKGCFLQADRSHGLGNARSLAVKHRFCCSWRAISWGQACPSGGESEIEVFLFAPLRQNRLTPRLPASNDC